MREYYPPFHIVSIPLDIHGNGPACHEDTVDAVYEIWDGANQILQTFDNEQAAKRALITLNLFTKDWPPYGSFRWVCMQLRLSFTSLINTIFK